LAGPPAAVGDLQRVLARLGVGKAHLVAQSMGGWTALGFALKHPEHVRSLVLSGTTAGIDTPAVRKAIEAYLADLAKAPHPSELPLGQHPALDAEFVRRDQLRAFLYQDLSLLNEGSAGGLIQRRTWYGRAELAALDVPVLFVAGSDDRIFPPAVIRDAAAVLPHASVVEIPGTGHSPYFERPEEWNRVVLDFVRRVGAPAEAP
jgi:pimeloyl-ACP methyl ester carboxylesterase